MLNKIKTSDCINLIFYTVIRLHVTSVTYKNQNYRTLFLNIVAVTRNALVQARFPAQKYIFKEFRHALSDPSSHRTFNGTVIGELLASEIVLQGAEHVKVRGCEVRAVRRMREYHPPLSLDLLQLSHVQYAGERCHGAV